MASDAFIGLHVTLDKVSLRVMGKENILFLDEVNYENIPSPENLKSDVIELIQKTLKRVNEKNMQVRGLGVITEPSVLLAKLSSGEFHRFLSWRDSTYSEEIELLRRFDFEFWREKTKNIPSSRFNIVRIMYFKNKFKISYQKVERFLDLSSFVIETLTGETVIDITTAHEWGLLNFNTRSWDSRLLEIFNVDESKLPKLINPLSKVGPIRKEITENIIDYEIPVYLVGSTFSSVPLLFKNKEKPYVILNYGTPNFVIAVVDKPVFSYTSFCGLTVLNEAFVVGNYYHTDIKKEITYFKNLLSVNKIDEKAISEKPPSRMLTIPRFTSSIIPFSEDYLDGAILGITDKESIEDIYQSLLAGIAYEIKKEIVDQERALREGVNEIIGINPDNFIALPKITTDVTGKKQTVFLDDLIPITAAIAIMRPTKENIEEINFIKTQKYIPNKEYTTIYNRLFKQYYRATRMLKDVFKQLKR